MTTYQREFYDKVNQSESISSMTLSSFLYGLVLIIMGLVLYSYPIILGVGVTILLIVMLGGEKLINKIVDSYKFIRNLYKV